MKKIPVLALGLGRRENGRIVEGTGIWNAPRDITINNKDLIQHTVGAAVRTELIAKLLHDATSEQLVPFQQRGYHTEYFAGLSGRLLRLSPLYSHYGDLLAKQVHRDNSAAWMDRAVQMDHYLVKVGARTVLQCLMAGELCHIAYFAHEKPTMKERYRYPHIFVPEIGDWWTPKKPTKTKNPLVLIAQNRRAIPYLPILHSVQTNFEAAMQEAFGPKIIDESKNAPNPQWANDILDAYAAQVEQSRQEMFGTE